MAKTKNNNTRKKILLCAEECFLEKGYSETTIRDIADKAAISVGTVYIYFKGKRDLFEALDLPEVEALHPVYDKKKSEVLQTALLLFGEHGYMNVTMDDIANNLGVTKAALYQYCSSKEDLLSQIIQSSSINLYARNLTDIQNDLNIRVVIKNIGRSFLQIGENPQRLALLKTVTKSFDQFPELEGLFYDEGIKPVCDSIVKYIQEHCRRNNLKVPTAKKLFSYILTYISTLQSYIFMNDVIQGIQLEISREDYLDYTTDVFLSFLKTNNYV